MIVGFDASHNTKNKNQSFGAILASMDLREQCKFSAVSTHKYGQELSNELQLNITKALKEFRRVHGILPQRVLFFRDGVGEGKMHYVYHHEIDQLRKTLFKHTRTTKSHNSISYITCATCSK